MLGHSVRLVAAQLCVVLDPNLTRWFHTLYDDKILMTCTITGWYANGLVRSNLAAADSGVNVSILVTLFQTTFQSQNAYSVTVLVAPLGRQLRHSI